jgi:putative ABC transport system substrate-binding protein
MRTIDRRRFLLDTHAALAALLLVPAGSHAQQADKVRRIGFLTSDTAESEAGQLALKLFPDALRELGYVEGKNLVIEWRWANGKIADLQKLAEELIRARVELIVARTNAPIQAAMKATKTIPIVMLNGNFPVESGLVKTLAQPGGNVTGTSYTSSPGIYEKHVQILKELAPRTDRIASLRNAHDGRTPLNQAIETGLVRAASGLGMTVHFFDVRKPEEIGSVLEAIDAAKIKAMWYAGDPLFRTRTAEIMAFLRDRRIAAIAAIPTFAEAGGLAHYAPDGRGFYDRTASYVDRILKGARPSELPVEESSKYELVINLNTAKMLGLTVSQSLRLRADRVIE